MLPLRLLPKKNESAAASGSIEVYVENSENATISSDLSETCVSRQNGWWKFHNRAPVSASMLYLGWNVDPWVRF